MDKAQTLLATDHLNPIFLQSVNYWTEEVIKNSELEEIILQQRAKEDCINLRYGNDAYFYAKLKEKNKQTQIKSLENAQGQILTDHMDLEQC